MSTRIDGAEAPPAPRAISIGHAAAIGLALLAIGLAIGLIVGRLQPGATSGQRRTRWPRWRLRPRTRRRSAGGTTTASAAEQLRRQVRAANAHGAYQADWRPFVAWCEDPAGAATPDRIWLSHHAVVGYCQRSKAPSAT
jgi:hypothetical protein